MNGYVNVAHRDGVVTQRRGWAVTNTWGIAWSGRWSWNVVHLPTGRVVDAVGPHSRCEYNDCNALCLSTNEAEAAARLLALACDGATGHFGGDPVFPPDGARRCNRMLRKIDDDLSNGREVGRYTTSLGSHAGGCNPEPTFENPPLSDHEFLGVLEGVVEGIVTGERPDPDPDPNLPIGLSVYDRKGVLVTGTVTYTGRTVDRIVRANGYRLGRDVTKMIVLVDGPAGHLLGKRIACTCESEGSYFTFKEIKEP